MDMHKLEGIKKQQDKEGKDYMTTTAPIKPLTSSVVASSKETAHNFYEDLKKGAYGEYLVKKYMHKFFEKRISFAEDKTAVKKYQKADIDFVVSFTDRAVETIEVKNDSTLSKNLFYETISVKREEGEDTPGCMLASEADVLFYVFQGMDLALVMSLPKLREWVNAFLSCGGTLQSKEVGNIGYQAEGYLVPIRLLMGDHSGWAGLEGLKIVDLSTNKRLDYEGFEQRRQEKLKESDGKFWIKVKREASWEAKSRRLWRNGDHLEVPLKADFARYKRAAAHVNKWIE